MGDTGLVRHHRRSTSAWPRLRSSAPPPGSRLPWPHSDVDGGESREAVLLKTRRAAGHAIWRSVTRLNCCSRFAETASVEEEHLIARAAAAAGLRKAGQHARDTQRRLSARGVIAIAALMFALFASVAIAGFSWVTVGAEAAVIGGLLTLERWSLPGVLRWGRGAAGEEKVGRVLDGLREGGWLALQDVHLGRGNIDHVVLGRAGIFTIETKSHRGRIRSERIDSAMLKQVRGGEANRGRHRATHGAASCLQRCLPDPGRDSP